MIIETKYNIGDKVFVIYNNKIREESIEVIDTITNDINKESTITYRFLYISRSFDELEVFSSREELLKSL